MNKAESQSLPVPPNLVKALRFGFDTVANHIGLILYAALFDLLLWFGPHISLSKLFSTYLNWSTQLLVEQGTGVSEFIQNNRDMVMTAAERFNLLVVLRTFPIGIPSLMVSRLPLVNPMGSPVSWQAPSIWILLSLIFSFILLGLMIGTIFFLMISQITFDGKIKWQNSISILPRSYLQSVLLSIFWLVVILGACLPLSCVAPFLLMGGAGFGSILVFLYATILIWLLFPLAFSPFGIFIHQDTMWVSLMRGARLVRFTLPGTALFLVIIFLVSQSLDWLWSTPKETSWMAIIGVIGHAFVATSFLAASFAYYRDAERWLEQRFKQDGRQVI